MTNKQQFFASLSDLMRKHKVQLNATDGSGSYGQHSPLIEVDFIDDYTPGSNIELSSLDTDDALLLSQHIL